jgi:hypothetical protein
MANEESYRVLVAGWRNWPRLDAAVVTQALDAVLRRVRSQEEMLQLPARELVVVEGACPYGGVDLYAHEWATANEHSWVASERWPASRSPAGAILGPQRNERMVRAGASEALAFPGVASRGTIDCMRRIVKSRIPMTVFRYDTGTIDSWRAGRVVA